MQKDIYFLQKSCISQTQEWLLLAAIWASYCASLSQTHAHTQAYTYFTMIHRLFAPNYQNVSLFSNFFCRKKKKEQLSWEPEMLRPQPRISWWEVIGIELLDIRHLPIDVWQQFSNLIELWSCSTSSPPSPILSFFFYTKIHESLASGVTVGWIKVLWLPLLWLKSPQFSWISLNEGIIHPRSYTTEPHKVKLMGENFNFVLEKCSLQSAQMCFIFLLCLSLHMSHSGEEANAEMFSPFISPFYVQLQDLLTLFNYGAFLKLH